ncbi:hypothetical protein NFI96_022333 [Prochilodus magdalenae]|nr:hypothetical protein NFI96_022333 [Prochilodus magdalenae]
MLENSSEPAGFRRTRNRTVQLYIPEKQEVYWSTSSSCQQELVTLPRVSVFQAVPCGILLLWKSSAHVPALCC